MRIAKVQPYMKSFEEVANSDIPLVLGAAITIGLESQTNDGDE